MNENKIVDSQQKVDDTAAVDAMKAEAKDLGFKSPFEDETAPKTNEKVEEKTEAKTEEVKTEVKVDENKTRQSRAPLRERLQKAAEDKLEAKHRDEIEKLQKDLENARKNTPAKDVSVELKERRSALAKKLNIEPTQVDEFLDVAQKEADERIAKIEARLTEKEKEETQVSEDEIIAEEEKEFNEHWNSVSDSIKEKYPNASKEQIENAKLIMEELAFSEKYQEYELDYILYKEKKSFDEALFSPKQRGFERSNNVVDDVDEEESDIFSASKPMTYKDVERLAKNTALFEESQADTRFSIK